MIEKIERNQCTIARKGFLEEKFVPPKGKDERKPECISLAIALSRKTANYRTLKYEGFCAEAERRNKLQDGTGVRVWKMK